MVSRLVIDHEGDSADFRLHDLRHTAASWLRMSGADLQEVADQLGHRDLRMTRRYSHLSPAHSAAVVKRLDKVFSKSKALVAQTSGSIVTLSSPGGERKNARPDKSF